MHVGMTRIVRLREAAVGKIYKLATDEEIEAAIISGRTSSWINLHLHANPAISTGKTDTWIIKKLHVGYDRISRIREKCGSYSQKRATDDEIRTALAAGHRADWIHKYLHAGLKRIARVSATVCLPWRVGNANIQHTDSEIIAAIAAGRNNKWIRINLGAEISRIEHLRVYLGSHKN